MSGRKAKDSRRAQRTAEKMMADALRFPVEAITYPGEFIPGDNALGPTWSGEYLFPVTYKHEDGKTIVGLSYMPPIGEYLPHQVEHAL